MTETSETTSDLLYDPTSRDLAYDPWPTFKRLRDEAPLYHREDQDFYALSRFEDVERAHVDRETFISGRGGTHDHLRGPTHPHRAPVVAGAHVHAAAGRRARG
jgi:cytochrome P450